MRRPRAQDGSATLLVSTPTRSTSASIESPAWRNLPRAAPTPSGVPVAMTSPGSSVNPAERTAMHSSIGKIIEQVVAVLDRLARRGQRGRPALDQLQHGLGEPAAPPAHRPPLPREIRRHLAEIEPGVPAHPPDPSPPRPLSVRHQPHSVTTPSAHDAPSHRLMLRS